jgi:hypothetical protein
MLADKTLLSVTLAATFASGTFVGFAARGDLRAGVPPHDASAIYAPQLTELKVDGYDATEMTEARQVYADYLKGYETWWNAFLDVNRAPLDKIEETRERRLAALAAKHLERTRAK